ncbi:Cna B-type domain-containing protein [Aliicoccus persicus]|uniref:Cna B-type domain-containing protein n=1 Tax=Aliicoccus persicus TaxID=930138 RepID=UPI002481D96E|nr:Cna B-type domain-containing protein [Aliicoccus persicus]
MVTKVWDDADNQDGIRSETVEAQLTGNGEEIGEPVTLSEENKWTNTWNELRVNEAGEAITYSVLEVNVLESYTSEIDDADHGDMIVTNCYTPSTIDIPVIKVWEDADNKMGRCR